MAGEKTEYEPREYWSRVAREIAKRPPGALLAGDDTPYFRRKRAAFVRRFLQKMPAAGKEVLEIGCGAGVNLIELERLGPRRLVGCDLAPDMVALARETTRGLAGVEVVELTGDGLPFADGEFDVTFTVTVLNHNHDDMLERVVGEAARVTRERLYLFEDTSTRKDVRRSYVLRPVEEYTEACARHGFRLVESGRLGMSASWFVSTAVRTVLNPRRRREGEPIGRVNAALEKTLLPATGVLDRVLPHRKAVLTKMVFAR
jgi:SAM-dependent methyltransferase